MTEETKPVNGHDAKQMSPEEMAAMMEAAKNRFLSEVVDHTMKSFNLLEMTDEDVTKVALNLMVNSYLYAYASDIPKATAAMEAFVGGTMRAMRHKESARLILPPGVGQH